MKNLPSIRSVGYRQAWQYRQGKLTYAAMQEHTIIATRQLAKRQMTWLRAWKTPDHLIPLETTEPYPVLQSIIASYLN
ncbi:hypothetical protein [Rickettsiella massiliensis]|uniref:hypothetical protein n=1 Tax=Rickettsiella massiliensis TaxID=676517 RepID=UPI0038B5B17B